MANLLVTYGIEYTYLIRYFLVICEDCFAHGGDQERMKRTACILQLIYSLHIYIYICYTYDAYALCRHLREKG